MTLLVRKTVVDDIAIIMRIWRDPEVLTGQYAPKPYQDGHWYASAMADQEGLDGTSFRSRTVLVEDTIVGHIMLNYSIDRDSNRKRCELGWNLDPQYWGQGIMTNAVRCLLLELQKTDPSLRMTASTNSSNRRCVGLLRKIGFVRVPLSEDDRLQHMFEGSMTEPVVQYEYLGNARA